MEVSIAEGAGRAWSLPSASHVLREPWEHKRRAEMFTDAQALGTRLLSAIPSVRNALHMVETVAMDRTVKGVLPNSRIRPV